MEILAARGPCSDVDGRGEEHHFDALMQGGIHLNGLSRHLFLSAAVDELDVLGPHTQSGARAVNGRVSTADDHDSPAETGRIAFDYPAQEVDAAFHSLEVLAVDVQRGRRPRAHGQVHRVKVVLELFQADLRAQGLAGEDRHAQGLDDPDLLIQGFLRQAVLGDAVTHHAAGLVLALEHGDGVTGDRGVIGGREA